MTGWPTGSARADGLRIDKWLWFARLCRTRSLAARLCTAGAVTVAGGQTCRPSHAVRVGDVVCLPRGRYRLTVQVLALGTRRGPAAEARRLYREAAPAEPLAASACAWLPLLVEEAGEIEDGVV